MLTFFVCGLVWVKLHVFLTLALDRSGQFHPLAALPMRNDPQVPIGQVDWATELLLWKERGMCFCSARLPSL
jgi:hypothetical protein